jgi:hypothetical protein
MFLADASGAQARKASSRIFLPRRGNFATVLGSRAIGADVALDGDVGAEIGAS